MKKIFALATAIIMTFSLAACGEDADNQVLEEEQKQEEQVVNEQEQSTEEPSVKEPVVKLSKVDWFIEEYNKVASNPITNAVAVDVTDEESGHYRTEFRLGAFSESYAKTGKIGDIVIDIVCYGWDNEDIRVYVDEIDLEQTKEIIKIASPILDSTLSGADIQEVLDYLDEYKSANGYYYGDIGIVYIGDLMMKVE